VNLSNLSPGEGSRRRRTRLGRGIGSGLGKTSGRGHKGQKARAGGGVRPWFEGGQTPLVRRLPKRGFKNPMRRPFAEVNLRALLELPAGSDVTPESLVAAGILHAGEARRVKILGDLGEPGPAVNLPALNVRAHAFTRSARAAITAAGGTAEVL
jgi:large subunit ribosomal protein L15